MPRNLLPYFTKVFHPKALKFLGKAAPWKALNRVIELTDITKAKAREIYETKKRLIESGDSATVKQVGDYNDIISLLSALMELHFTITVSFHPVNKVKANVAASDEGRLSEEEVLAQMRWATNWFLSEMLTSGIPSIQGSNLWGDRDNVVCAFSYSSSPFSSSSYSR